MADLSIVHSLRHRGWILFCAFVVTWKKMKSNSRFCLYRYRCRETYVSCYFRNAFGVPAHLIQRERERERVRGEGEEGSWLFWYLESIIHVR